MFSTTSSIGEVYGSEGKEKTHTSVYSSEHNIKLDETERDDFAS